MSILQGLGDALKLLFNLDPHLWGIVGRSLQVSLLAIALAACLAVPLGAVLGLIRENRFLKGFIVFNNALMGLPPVVAGLVVYILLSRQGPLGSWQLLFTVTAMVIVQVVLAFPIILGLSLSAVQAVPPGIREAAKTLGASPREQVLAVMREAKGGLLVAIAAGLGRVLAEVGAVMLVGGNIAGRTRVMTTAIVLETRQGNFGLAMGLGLILILLSVGLNMLINALGGKGAWR
jgi:tungstate transport system permease protein